MSRARGFTLLEILIVISILAILGVAVIPALLGHDYEARHAATMQNLQALRTAIDTYQSKTGTFPSDTLIELTTIEFDISNKKRTILREMPPELISKNDLRPAEQNPPNREIRTSLSSDGGWYYNTKSGYVSVNYNQQLPKEWGKYAGQNPSTW